MQGIKLFLSALTTQDYVTLGLGVLVIVLLFIFRESKIVIDTIGNAIVEAETKLNSEDGQKRLDYAVTLVQNKLPTFAKIFITKKMIVSLIELMLNSMNKAFKIDKTVDIKGNEDENK